MKNRFANPEDKAYEVIKEALEDEGFFIDDEADEKMTRLAEHVARFPVANNEADDDD